MKGMVSSAEEIEMVQRGRVFSQRRRRDLRLC